MPFLTTGLIVALLVALGVWQLQRRVEKHRLIAALEERLNAAPVPLPPESAWAGLTPAADEFRRVRFTATLDTTRQAYVYGSGSALRPDVKGPGRWAFAPARLADGEQLAVNRGFVPDGTSEAAPQSQPVELRGYIRFPEPVGWLTPAADLAKRLWFVRDPAAMAQAGQWGRIAPFYVDLEGPEPPRGVPMPGPLDVHLKDDHLQYALTWFSLAALVLVAFGVWLRGRRNAT